MSNTEVIPASEWAGRVKLSKSQQLHDTFAFQMRTRRLPIFTVEHRFAREALKRQWKFDFCWPEYMVAVELEGLVCRKLFDATGQSHNVVMGRHATIGGFIEDAEKYGNATILGWSVLRFAQAQVKDQTAINFTMRMLAAKGWVP